MENYYQFLVPRLNGADIRKNFARYLSFVRKGAAGFIIFGGEIEEVRSHIEKLQAESAIPLIIASDLERGLGQQLKGGTDFPPAMALANAVKREAKKSAFNLPLLRRAFRALAAEAAYAGINTILAPVLDINTNPKNPIIATRAFGEDLETVSLLGCEMIKALQGAGIAACGKHFPGHGDTAVDSHIRLPVINRPLASLKKNELRPFQAAARCGVKMIMLGHLSVPAMDPSGTPVSISEKAVSYLRTKMNYQGILITDAMNMGGLGKYTEEKASFMALRSDVDIILHPSDPDKVAAYLAERKHPFRGGRLQKFRQSLCTTSPLPDFERNSALSVRLTEKAIRISEDFAIGRKPAAVILNDEKGEKGKAFAKSLREFIPRTIIKRINSGQEASNFVLPENAFLVVSVFSETRGWKGGASGWLYKQLESLRDKADLFVSFGSPYLLDEIEGPKVFAYWDNDSAQIAAAELIAERWRP